MDTFGLAYYHLGLGDDFKDVVQAFIPVRNERGLELFYDVALTPWMHLTLDLQVVAPLLEDADIALLPGIRLRIA